jgi:hypothetical protein
MMKTFKSLLSILALLGLLWSFTACQAFYTKRIVFDNHPISIKVISEVDYETETVEYFVIFRNVGTQVVTFDYTIADEEGVVHIDQDGPNSGLIENLYPGAEERVPNPVDSLSVWVTLGSVTYGKKDSFDLENVYRPDAAIAADPSSRLQQPILEEY